MNKMQTQVREFHEAFGVPVNDKPIVISPERRLLRAKLIQEEYYETLKALGVGEDACGRLDDETGTRPYLCVDEKEYADDPDKAIDLAEIADGLTDLLYVTIGAMIELGLDAEKCFDCVHDVNMAKAWTEEEVNFYYIGGGIDKEKLIFTPTATGRFAAQREDGKIKKSPSFKAPDLSSVISKQML